MNKMKYLIMMWKKLLSEERGDMGLTLIAVSSIIFLLSVTAGYVNDNLTKYTYVKGNNRYVDATRAPDWASKPEPVPIDTSKGDSTYVVKGPVINRNSVFWGNVDPESYKRTLLSKIHLVKSSTDTEKQLQTGILHEAAHWANAQQDILTGESSVNTTGQSQNDQISKQLKAMNVSDDALNIDIYKTVENLVYESSIPGLAADALNNLTSSVVKSVLRNTTPSTPGKTVQAVSDELNKQKALATQELINQRKNLKLLQQAKQEYEQRVAIIDKMLSKGDSIWAKNLADYKNDRRILDDLNNKIANAKDSVAALEEKLRATKPNIVSLEPTTLTGEINKDYTFTAKLSNPSGAIIYEWYREDYLLDPEGNEKATLTFKKEGAYTIIVKAKDKATGRYIGTAKSVVNIKTESVPSEIQQKLVLEPASLTGEINKAYTYAATLNNAPSGSVYEWWVAQEMVDATPHPINKTSITFKKEGTYTITVKVRDTDTSNIIAQATATAIIRSSIAPTAPAKTGFEGTYSSQNMYMITVSGDNVTGIWGDPNGSQSMEFIGKIDAKGNVYGTVKGRYVYGQVIHTGKFNGEIIGNKLYLRWEYDDVKGPNSTILIK